jgi:hypothetical protein
VEDKQQQSHQKKNLINMVNKEDCHTTTLGISEMKRIIGHKHDTGISDTHANCVLRTGSSRYS